MCKVHERMHNSHKACTVHNPTQLPIILVAIMKTCSLSKSCQFLKSTACTMMVIIMPMMTTTKKLTMMRVVECCHFLPEFLHSFPGFQSQLLTTAHYCSLLTITHYRSLLLTAH